MIIVRMARRPLHWLFVTAAKAEVLGLDLLANAEGLLEERGVSLERGLKMCRAGIPRVIVVFVVGMLVLGG